MKKTIYNYSIDPDPETIKQFKNCYEEKFVVKAALMPDAHRGYVAPIGSVLITKEFIVPSWVGYDIGCGMTAVKLSVSLEKIKNKVKLIHSQVKRDVPMGLGEINKPKTLSNKSKKQFDNLIEKFKKGPHNKGILQFLESGKPERHLGSLGHGNHFIELSYIGNDIWIVVHSGSRGVGHHTAQEYMKKSANKNSNYEETFPLSDSSDLGKEYLNILDFCLEFALLNRLEIITKVINSIEKVLKTKISHTLWVNKNHNHAIKDHGYYIHRKGATPAKKKERGVIPANMRDGSFLVEGKGNPKFLSSSSHGAGRALGRNEARKKISLLDMKKQMKGIEADTNEKFLDEAPEAYKDIFQVLNAQKESIKVLKHLKPLINWKG